MATIILRQGVGGKGSPLTNAEVDANFTNLNNNKLEITGTAASATVALNISGGTAGSIPYQTAANTTALVAPGTAGYVLVSNGTAAPSWVKASAGAKGSGNDEIFWENDKTITADYTLTASKNAGSFGPITIGNGVTVTIPDTSNWTIV